ncbi:MAG: RDD family protein [Pseudorhodobacter sp.]|nr:RDD family protein [Pseudorhodobacter sp.]
MGDEGTRPATWKIVVAAIFDFLLVFLVGGYLIAIMTGDATDGGFELTGAPALLLFALVIAYFVVMNKWLGGTVFKRLFGIAGR